MIETKAVFRRKDNEIEAKDCVVNKVIRLSGMEFDRFSRNLMSEWSFIRNNPIARVVDENGRYHCLLVLGEERRDGILVNPEGSSYARYSAFLPNAELLFLEYVKDQLSDPTVTRADMYAYGYGWDGMIPLSKEGALALWDKGHEIFRLYENDAEGAVDNRAEIESFDGLFGMEDPAWKREEVKDAAADEEPALPTVADATPDVESEAMYIDKAFAGWKATLDQTEGAWREDKRYRQHKDGALYYIGGGSGQYMRVGNDGKLTVGTYELARFGIGDAVLWGKATEQYGSYEQAFLRAAQLGGPRFMADIFNEKPSVLGQIREARNAPPVPPKQRDGHNIGELDL